jgi:integrase
LQGKETKGMITRRAKGAGTIRQRIKNSWEIRYDAPDNTGTMKRRTETVRGSRRDAEKALRDRLGQVDTGGFVPKTTETVAEFMHKWLFTYAATNTKPSTQRGYAGAIRRYIAPSVGHLPLQAVQPFHIQKMHADMLGRGLSERTTLHAHTILKQALNHAVKWGLLVRNVAHAVDAPRPPDVELEMWDVPTIHRFIKAAKESPFGDLYHLAILTGMRRGELVGLKWEYVNLDAQTLAVTNTLQRINGMGIVEGGPKSRRSRRQIALGNEATRLLTEVRTRQLEKRLSAGPLWEDRGYVFCQDNGRSLHPDKVSNKFKQIVDENALPHLSLKGLRHAHATLLLSAGIHPKVVSERLGHSRISVTMDIYSHVMPGMQEEAARAVDEALAFRS